ncbi:MAG: FHA domain-containing protein [Planctomycetaceae bacterium]
MALVTLQAIDGLERGRIFRDLTTPINIGREDDNQIRLNDERVSRCHAKVQEHEGRFILTDLDSTNGTRVNGHPITMHVLQIGDQLQIGRCLLLFGSPEELAARCDNAEPSGSRRTVQSLEELATYQGEDECQDLFPDGPPPLPERLNGIQTAQTEDVLAYFHSTLLQALYSVEGAPDETTPLESVEISARHWHRLQRLQTQLATYLREIGQPRDA